MMTGAPFVEFVLGGDRIVVEAVGMWESRSDFQGQCVTLQIVWRKALRIIWRRVCTVSGSGTGLVQACDAGVGPESSEPVDSNSVPTGPCICRMRPSSC